MTGAPAEERFLVEIQPALARGDLSSTLACLADRWPPSRLIELLDSTAPAVLTLAARCLGLCGGLRHCAALVGLLGHDNQAIVTAAEDALWSIWMRAGSPEANRALAAAVERVRHEDLETAADMLERLIAAEPSFAEAHHQFGLTLHSLQRIDPAEQEYREALRLNPYHFAAAAGLGHICVERGNLGGALLCYRSALQIHPRLAGIREIVPHLEAAVQRRVVA